MARMEVGEPERVGDRTGPANVGFFIETNAHMVEKNNREAAEQVALR